jgi:hypothetical protein
MNEAFEATETYGTRGLIDSVLSANRAHLLIKSDAPGDESAVLNGTAQTVKNDIVVIQIKVLSYTRYVFPGSRAARIENSSYVIPALLSDDHEGG